MERDTDRWRETTTVRRREKRGEEDVPVGSRALKKKKGKKNLPADWSGYFHNPAASSICFWCYCTGVCKCMCEAVQDKDRKAVRQQRKNAHACEGIRRCGFPFLCMSECRQMPSDISQIRSISPTTRSPSLTLCLRHTAGRNTAKSSSSNSICHSEVTHSRTHMEGRWAHSCRCQWRCLGQFFKWGLVKKTEINKHRHRNTCWWYEPSLQEGLIWKCLTGLTVQDEQYHRYQKLNKTLRLAFLVIGCIKKAKE